MARRGRKRKAGRRHPSGQLASERRPDDRQRAAAQPHRRGLPKEMRLSELAESSLGRLFLRGLLAEYVYGADREEVAKARYDAGDRFRAIVGAYRAVIGAPSGTAGSGRGFACDADGACIADRDNCLCLRRQRRYEAAFEALAATGRPAAMEVKQVVVLNEELQPGDLVNLVRGLDALAALFGLTGRPARHDYANSK